MIYLIITLALLTILCAYMGWRIGKLEDEAKEMKEAEQELGEFIDDILDTLDVLRHKEDIR